MTTTTRIRTCWVALWLFAVAPSLGCSDEDPGQNPPVGTVVFQQQVDIGPVGLSVDLGPGSQGGRVEFPPGVLATPTRVTVRVSGNVSKGGTPVVAPVLQIATPQLVFAVPARLRQTVPAPAPGKQYVAVGAAEADPTWTIRGQARAVPGTSDFEIDIHGSGLWALALSDLVAPPPPPMDAGTSPDGGIEGGDGGATSTMPPQLTALNPTMGTAGAALDLEVVGEGISPGWWVYFDGLPYPTTFGSGTMVRAVIPANATAVTGTIAVWLGVPGAPTRMSNTLYFNIAPAPGVPIVVDFSPDNGLPGGRVVIVGQDFAAEPFTIRDAAGNDIPTSGEPGTTTWVGVTRETVEFVIRDNMRSGPLTLTNSKGSFRSKVFNVGQNLSRIAGATATASSQYNTAQWSIASGWDNNLQTSWFSANGDCASQPSCTSVPWFKVAFPAPQIIQRIALRGNREYQSGYDYVAGTFDILGVGDAVLWSASYNLPAPDRDLDIVLPIPVTGAHAVRFTSREDESIEPGFAELEVFAPSP